MTNMGGRYLRMGRRQLRPLFCFETARGYFVVSSIKTGLSTYMAIVIIQSPCILYTSFRYFDEEFEKSNISNPNLKRGV